MLLNLLDLNGIYNANGMKVWREQKQFGALYNNQQGTKVRIINERKKREKKMESTYNVEYYIHHTLIDTTFDESVMEFYRRRSFNTLASHKVCDKKIYMYQVPPYK